MKVVIGGTYRDMVRWANENKLGPREVIWVGDEPERLMGLELKEEDIVRLGPIDRITESLIRSRIR